MWILETPEGWPEKPRVFRITAGSQKTLGRSPTATFPVDVPLVSRLHCRLWVNEAGALEIEDLQSTNGTFLNDARIARGIARAGDRLRIGRLELEVKTTSNSEPTHHS